MICYLFFFYMIPIIGLVALCLIVKGRTVDMYVILSFLKRFVLRLRKKMHVSLCCKASNTEVS